MKKKKLSLNQKRQNKIALFGFGILSLICLMCFFSTDLFGVQLLSVGAGTSMAVTLAFPADLGLTDKEKGAFNTVGEFFNKEFEAFQKNLGSFNTKEGIDKAFADFKTDIEKQYKDNVNKEDFDKLEKAIIKQGEALAALKLQGGNTPEKTLKQLLTENKEAIDKMIEEGGAGRIEIKTTTKAISGASVTSDTNAYRIAGLPGEIHRGVPYLRNLFQVVNLGGNTHGSVKWYEQLSVTNNASTTAGDPRSVGTASNLTWVEKNISGKRIVDWLKIGMDSLKDVDFVLGEIQRLVERNMRLKENDQLLNGDGTGNNIKGIISYAQPLVTLGGGNITNPNIIDMCGKIVTQIVNGQMGAANPNYCITNRVDMDKLRFAKTSQGAYVFPQFTMGQGMSQMSGCNCVENPLVTANTFLAGDFSLATLYVWDDLVIEIAQIEDDKKTGMTTILAYTRENLRVQTVDAQAFVYVPNVNNALTAMATGVATV